MACNNYVYAETMIRSKMPLKHNCEIFSLQTLIYYFTCYIMEFFVQFFLFSKIGIHFVLIFY